MHCSFNRDDAVAYAVALAQERFGDENLELENAVRLFVGEEADANRGTIPVAACDALVESLVRQFRYPDKQVAYTASWQTTEDGRRRKIFRVHHAADTVEQMN